MLARISCKQRLRIVCLQEMLDVMGHKTDSASFKHFSKLCVQIYLAVRPYYRVCSPLKRLNNKSATF